MGYPCVKVGQVGNIMVYKNMKTGQLSKPTNGFNWLVSLTEEEEKEYRKLRKAGSVRKQVKSSNQSSVVSDQLSGKEAISRQRSARRQSSVLSRQTVRSVGTCVRRQTQECIDRS